MTEAEWQCCTDPVAMLKALPRKASDRKLRLFACVCCRTIPSLLSYEPLRKGIETAERYADQHATSLEMVGSAKAAAFLGWWLPRQARALSDAVWTTTAMNLWFWLRPVARTVRTVRHLLSYNEEQAPLQAVLLRDILGNPFHPLPVLTSSWLTPRVEQLANAIYDDRAFGHLPLLADALEEAGCDNAYVLQHLRVPGEHARGCWLIDAILEKEAIR